jgi:hypothetical protein
VSRYEQVTGLAPATADSSQFPASSAVAGLRTRADGSVPGHPIRAADHPDHADHADQVPGSPPAAGTSGGEIETAAAAVAAYRASVQDSQPISERKLAEMFGKTSRRWARSRMAEARQSPAPV